MDLESVVDELYALPPGEFIPRRTELAKQATGEGDRALAALVKKLRRPTDSAAAINALARLAPQSLAGYLELGARLRRAQAELAGEQMRALSQQRQVAGADLAAQAIDLFRHTLSVQGRRELDDTLRAAVADPAAAAAVASGRLTRALAYAGLGEVDITAATATPLHVAPDDESDAADNGAAARARAEAEAARAEAVQAEAAQRHAEQAQTVADHAQAAYEAAADRLLKLERLLTAAQSEARAAKDLSDSTRRDADVAWRAATPARR